MSGFSTAKNVIGFVEIVGWVTIGFGGLSALTLHSDFGLAGVLVGLIGVGGIGLMLIVSAQISRAVIATAESNLRILDIIKGRQSVGIAPAALPMPPVSTVPPTASVSTQQTVTGDPQPVTGETYRGHMIAKTDQGFAVAGSVFVSAMDARRYVDNLKRRV